MIYSARRVGDQGAAAGAAQLAQSPTHHLAAVDATARTRVDVFDGHLIILAVRVLQQPDPLEVVAGMDLAADQQRYALLDAQGAHARAIAVGALTL